jgi:hypothetical protein
LYFTFIISCSKNFQDVKSYGDVIGCFDGCGKEGADSSDLSLGREERTVVFQYLGGNRGYCHHKTEDDGRRAGIRFFFVDWHLPLSQLFTLVSTV